jgi:DNA processing protein
MILGIEELLKDLGLLQGSPVLKQPSSTGPSDPQQQLLWQLLGEGILSLDALAQASQMDIATLSSTLLLMELEGWLVQLPGMRYQRAR